MHSEVASEIWRELKRYINTVDRTEAAETLISTLVNYDEDVDDIRDAFKGDSDIKRALTTYLDNDKDYSEEEDDETFSHYRPTPWSLLPHDEDEAEEPAPRAVPKKPERPQFAPEESVNMAPSRGKERRKARKAAGVRFIPLEDRIADVEWMEDVVRMTAAELTAKYGVSDRQGFRWKRLVA